MAIVTIEVPASRDDYVFIPACCYAGNAFDARVCKYPPMFTPAEARVDQPVTITDVPRLAPDGRGRIQVTTGDASVPCVGVFSPTRGRGVLVFTIQQIKGRNLGLGYEDGRITLTWPARRERIYRWPYMKDNPEAWEDLPAEIPYKVLDFECASLHGFFRVFFENRKIMGLDDARPADRPVAEVAAIQIRKFNSMNWHETLGCYMVGTDRTRYQVWQPGWVGGGLSSYALMKLGGATEWARGMRTLEFLCATQCESGFFHGVIDDEGRAFGDGFDTPGTDGWHLIRKSADILYFFFKHFSLMRERGEEIPEAFLAAARRTADGFVRLWKTYGQFGQFVDVHTGEICVGGSTSAAIAPAGLIRAYAFFGDPVYREVAEESAEAYGRVYLDRGYITGGPGEILQCPDSESAFGLLESFVVLYEVTGEERWLRRARECAHYASSWVVAYNYVFPPQSEFGRQGKRTVGCVFANVQNKHAAPGICTLSGDSLCKLWRWTGDTLYLELIRDISQTIGPCMSTKEEPIYDWGLTPEARSKADPAVLEAHRLPEGFICERVNMSDWETEARVGGVFNGSCWAETSLLLTLADGVLE